MDDGSGSLNEEAPLSHFSLSQLALQQQQFEYRQQQLYHDYHHQASPPPLAPYATSNTNLHAFAANASLDDTADPDDFYRSYQTEQLQYHQTGHESPPLLTEPPSMAQPLSSARQTPSMRSNGNGNGTTPKHASSSSVSVQRNPPRPSHRSVSNPADPNKSAGAFPTSVKDLKKKFDQTSPSSGSTTRKPVPRTSRDRSTSSANGRTSSGVGGSATSYSAGRTAGSRGLQRPKALAEDHGSSNSQSFASRLSRPPSALSQQASPSRKAKTHPQPGSVSSDVLAAPSRPNGLLFGEILPGESDSVTAGFGIDNVRPRRTSESNIHHNSSRMQMRSLSDPDIEPPSPTDWYRTPATTLQNSSDQQPSRIPKNHLRTQSDLASSKLTIPRHIDSTLTSPISPTSPTSPTSRLPIMIGKMSNQRLAHDSPGSTRSSSPSTMKHGVPSGRTSRQHGSIADRSRTPTTSSSMTTGATPTKTPTGATGSNRKPPPSKITTPGTGRLNAYVSVPAPKLSPSLRSSRPRQSVATATTAASRMRTVERGASPHRQPVRGAPKAEEPGSRRNKVISVGPINFAERRETIKLAYSKSIRESQANEARQAAAERRKKELEVVARVKAEAEAATMAAVANANAAAASTIPRRVGDHHRLAEIHFERDHSSAEPEQPGGLSESVEKVSVLIQPPDEITAPSSATPALAAISAPISTPMEPLRLEIPGSFPNAGSPQLESEDIPCSAISATSAITEFDIDDDHTEAGTPENAAASTAAIDEALGISSLPQQTEVAFESEIPEQQQQEVLEEPSPAPVLHKRASYHYPFDDDEGMDDDSVSIKISLDTSAEPQASPQLTPTRPDFDSEQTSIPAPALDDEEAYVLRPYAFASGNYETTVTILGPENDFRPLHKDQPRVTMSAADLPQENEPPVTGAPNINAPVAPHLSEMKFENHRIELEQLDRIEDFYVGTRLSDNVARLRDSTYTSSDAEALYDTRPPSLADYQKTPETSHSLTVPSLLVPANRLSQHSAWTDFSFGSDVDGPSSLSHTSHPRDSGLILSADDRGPRDSGLGRFTHSPETSPLDKSGVSTPSMLNGSSSNNQLADSDPSEDVNRDYEPQYSEKIPVLPDHAPPPPPPFEPDYEQTNSVYMVNTRPSSYLHEQDDTEVLPEVIIPLDSASQITLETQETIEQSRPSFQETLNETAVDAASGRPSLSAEAQEEQKRLRQRQLVIRELIDTEDAFVRDMSVVEEIYKGTAEACPNLDNKTIKLIFRNTDEIIAFHAAFLAEFKEGASSVYTPKSRRSPLLAPAAGAPPVPSLKDSDSATLNSVHSSNKPELDDEKDRLTSIGPVFSKSIDQLKAVHEVYLRSSDHSSKRLVQIQEDKTVMLWLNECNEVAKELTSAWNLDSLLVKPMQRITKYPDIITHLLKYTPADHPDREALVAARLQVIDAIDDINKSKKNYELVGQIVGNRKRKDSDVRGLARAFGKRVDKLQASGTKTAEDEDYKKLHQQFGDDYLRLQVVLRDVEYYTRNVTTYVHEFLQYLSSMELVMRLQPSRDYAHLESKWVQFNVSMRDIEKVALERHLADVRKHVIEPFEQVIKCYGNPGLAMKKRAKRRLDYEKFVQLKANGKKVDKQLMELVEQYEALNETLKKELPKLSAMTAKIGNICLGKFISIQTAWYLIWKEKVKAPLQDAAHVPELSEIVSAFQSEFMLQEERAMAIGILNPTLRHRASHSTTDDGSSVLSRTKSRPSDLLPTRGRGLSINSDHVPTLPTPDFVRRNSGQFSLSPASSALPSPAHYYRDYYSGITAGHSRGTSNSPIVSDSNHGSRSAIGLNMRPSTGRSFDAPSLPRQSTESTTLSVGVNRRDSNSTYNSAYHAPETRRLSGLFHSALPMDADEGSQMPSRASSTNRGNDSGYRVLWLAASLFEFNIETTKHEAGYPYLTYQAGEIFDVIAEKGELWLAKNQDDPGNTVGWIWSKHFAKLADS
ncbi:hypothetical protein QBC38DRAFT_28312 [Podospora fimiseda]|uniref:DH domain-containing protein n=1 Tax=Podospora fimiseda TaxID=252190 RepID=A0AAN7BVU8_9PEZI|nr:hypothetical protein QBC38DRAFT_28312 [Podospora fimiseda]